LRIILQLMKGGSLLEGLKTLGKSRLRTAELLRYALQMCSALRYLKHEHIIHRDIAARNILLDEGLSTAKLGDFGLAVTVEEIEKKQKSENLHDIDVLLKSKIAVKWTSPESLEKGEYTYQSEMWSFGILLWEMWSYGRVPYRKIYVEKVLTEIKHGTRCEIIENSEGPNKIPLNIRNLLTNQSLWAYDSALRPTIETVTQIVQESHS